MKIYVNDIVKNEVIKSKIPKSRLAAEMGLSRIGLSKILEREYIDSKYIIAIGKIIRYDFSVNFPELHAPADTSETLSYDTLDNHQLRSKLIELQAKYVHILEEYIKLLNKK